MEKDEKQVKQKPLVFDIKNLKFYLLEKIFNIKLYRGNEPVKISQYAINQINGDRIEEFWISIENNEMNLVALFKNEEDAIKFQEEYNTKEYPLYINYDWLLLDLF
ncbi:MAG: hypothetical protein ACTSRP_11010 [Candidatus Helarchaeota archaeon]